MIFNDTFRLVKGLKFDEETSEHDMIVATQRLTDMMLKQYSPATSGKEYHKYLDNYFISDEKFMDDFMRKNFEIKDMTNDQLKEIMGELKADITEKKKVLITDIEVTSKNEKKSERVEPSLKLDNKVKAQ
jgi:hypothetical protein